MPATDPITAARAVVTGAVLDRTFPAAVVEVGDSGGVLWREAFGTLTFEPASAAADDHTIFDLSSLTKPIATTSVIMQLESEGVVRASDRVSLFFEEWRGPDRESTTVQDLLEHASGLAARLVDAPPEDRREFEHDICTMRLECPPRTRSIYSDLGFILLGFMAADRGAAPLATQFDRILGRLRAAAHPGFDDANDMLAFAVPGEKRHRTAPTSPLDEDLRRGRMLIGEAHDNYAAALGGVAGHAGLFGTAPAVGVFARTLLAAARGDATIPQPLTQNQVARVTTRSTVPGSSRALGWDTMLTTSSCGAHLSSAAFGHVGFTGTSLWVDPILDRYFVLLTNRACGTGTKGAMRVVRRAFHDALARL
ncbi:MAG: serine hydrolase [Luteitalea sp.]|nr:serine hydrolase [Luteitalea sp.]